MPAKISDPTEESVFSRQEISFDTLESNETVPPPSKLVPEEDYTDHSSQSTSSDQPTAVVVVTPPRQQQQQQPAPHHQVVTPKSRNGADPSVRRLSKPPLHTLAGQSRFLNSASQPGKTAISPRRATITHSSGIAKAPREMRRKSVPATVDSITSDYHPLLESRHQTQESSVTSRTNSRAPSDESSDVPSERSLLTQPVYHPMIRRGSEDSASTNNNNHHHYHPRQQNINNSNSSINSNSVIFQEREPSQELRRWDSSDRSQFPTMDIQRMRNKLHKLREMNSKSTCTTSSSTDETKAPSSSGQNERTQKQNFAIESSFIPFATSLQKFSAQSKQNQKGYYNLPDPPVGNNPFGREQQYPKGYQSHAASAAGCNPFEEEQYPKSNQSQPTSAAGYNPFGETQTPPQPQRNRELQHGDADDDRSNFSLNPFAALVAALSPNPPSSSGGLSDRATFSAGGSSSSGAAAAAARAKATIGVYSVEPHDLDGASQTGSHGGSTISSNSTSTRSSKRDGQSVRRKKTINFNNSSHGNAPVHGKRITSRGGGGQGVRSSFSQDSGDALESLEEEVELTLVEDYSSQPQQQQQQQNARVQQLVKDDHRRRLLLSSGRPPLGRTESQRLVEKSLVKSFHRKGTRRRRRSSSPVSATATTGNSHSTPPSPSSQTSRQSSQKQQQQQQQQPPSQNVFAARGSGRSSVVSEAPTEELDDSLNGGETATRNDDDEGIDENLDQSTTRADNDEEHQHHPVLDFTLHDLCGEASSTDDVAWRNALYLLSTQPHLASIRDMNESSTDANTTDADANSNHGNSGEEQVSDGHGWTPLHISCLGQHPPPTFIIRGLLYANPEAVKRRDDGGRLPLHLIAASSADVATMELLLQVWPHAISKRDHKGLTPIHLLLRNKRVPLTPKNASVLLGVAHSTTAKGNAFWKQMQQEQQQFILQRRGQHLNMTLKEMDDYITKRHNLVTTVFHPDYGEVDEEWNSYPQDAQAALRKLAKWRKLQQHPDIHKRHYKDQRHMNSAPVLQLLSAQEEEDDEEDNLDGLLGEESNPAAIPHYPDLKLPIHMAVARGIVRPVSLDAVEEDDEYSDESDDEVESQPKKSRPAKEVAPESRRSSVEDIYSVLRCIISAFPEGLCVRDADGMTPLLHIMTMTDGLPTPDLIDLLLGKQSGAFDSIPPWLAGVPLHSICTLPENHYRFLSPAMVASGRTNQLPLHIAAEEFVAQPEIVESIYNSYPAAVDVQDHRGRTPLHLIFSNYRLFPASPRMVSLLMSNSAAKCRDVDGNLPFDMLLQAAEYLPKRIPDSWEAEQAEQVYQKFFTASLMTFSNETKGPNSSEFLQQLKRLPPWIRRQACSVIFVQEMIIEELSRPWQTAFVALDGLLLMLVLALFRAKIKEYTDVVGLLAEELSGRDVYVGTVCAAVVMRLLLSCIRTISATSIGQGMYLVILNGWFWIDFAAMVITLVVAALVRNPDAADDTVLSMATGATALLWLSLLGYCATWFYGMALLLGSLVRIANQIVWPLLVGGMALIAFAQMFYTLLWTDCVDAIPTLAVCSVRDSYRVVYLLLRGESLVVHDGSEEISPNAIVLVSAFLVFLFGLLLAVLVAVIIGALHTNSDEVALRAFWEPKLAVVISFIDWGFPKFGGAADIQTRLERTWELLIASLLVGSPARNQKYWYAGRHREHGYRAWAFWLTSLVVVPLWFVLGLFTLGLLWPPQLRRLLFRPFGWMSAKQQSLSSIKSEYVASQLSTIQSELVRTKTMSYVRSVQLENEIRAVKQLLYAAVLEQ